MSKTPCGIHAAAVALASLALSLPSATRAQERCPDPDVEMVPGEQAVCWMAEDRAGSDRCARDAAGRSSCARAASRWCDSADISDANAASACVLAFVAVGRFDALYAILRSLPAELSPDADRCRDAFSTPMATRIVTNPEGGEVWLDGRALGPGPVDAALSHPFLAHHVVVRFAGPGGEEERALSEEDLSAAFDPASCTLGQLLVVGPAPPRGAGGAETARTMVAPPPPGRDDALTVAGALTATLGASMGITGIALLAVAESEAISITNVPEGTRWSDSRASALETIGTLRPVGWALAITGAVAAVTGLTLIVVDQTSTGPPRPSAEVRLGIDGVIVRGSF